MSTNNYVERLAKKVKDKKKLSQLLSEEFGIGDWSIRNNWLSNHYSVPQYRFDRFVEITKNFIREENNKKR